MKKILKIGKKIVFAFLIIYAYNAISLPMNAIVPINILNVLFVTILGFPALLCLIILNVLIV